MLELLRRKAQSPYLQATVIIIVLVFVFWGVGTNHGPGRNAVVTVNEEAISYSDFQHAYDRALSNYRDRFGGVLPENIKKALNIRGQVITQLVDHALMLQGAAHMGLRVSDDEVRKAIQTMGSFQTDGHFDVERYKQLLANSRLTPANYEASIRTDLLTAKVAKSLGRFARISPDEVNKRFLYDYETFSLDYLTLTADAYKARVTVDDKALATFFDAEKENYKTAPQVKLQYLFFSNRADANPPTEEEIKAYYDQNIENYSLPEQRRVRHILLRATSNDSKEKQEAVRKQLEGILAQASEGKDFAALAKQYSQDTSAVTGGDLGFFSRGQMVAPFEAAAFALTKPGELSDVIQTRFGYHILQLEEIKPAHQQELAEVRDAISAKLQAEQGNARAFKRAGDAYEQIILAGSLAKYAEAHPTDVKETDFFTQQAPPAELADKQAILSAAFSLKKDELSSMIDDHDGYAILFVADAKEPEVPPLDQVRARVEADFIAKQAKGLARDAAQSLLDQLRKGADFGEEAKKLGLDILHTKPFTHTGRSSAELPAPVLDAAVELTMQAPYPDKVLDNGTSFYVIRLAERKDPAPELLTEKEGELRERLLQENRMALLDAWLQTLKNTAEITYNQELLKD